MFSRFNHKSRGKNESTDPLQRRSNSSAAKVSLSPEGMPERLHRRDRRRQRLRKELQRGRLHTLQYCRAVDRKRPDARVDRATRAVDGDVFAVPEKHRLVLGRCEGELSARAGGDMKQTKSLFEDARMKLPESIELTVQSLIEYGARYKHWAIAYSGGKDSSATVTLVASLIEQGRIPEPESLTILYADTRMELPPLHLSAMSVMDSLRERGYQAHVVLPPLDKRYFVYMLGRGVPPPNNNTLRWCTRQIKVNPMIAALRGLRDSIGEKFLMLTGVRLGESAARDSRITLSCSRDGGECGQGWFQQATPESVADTLAPLLHWRVCHVWAWLNAHAPGEGFPTRAVAAAYGGDEAEEVNARTGCVGCPLAKQDTALDTA